IICMIISKNKCRELYYMNAFISVVTNGITPPKNVKTAIAIAIIISSLLILRCYESLYLYYSKRLHE
ncbi:hypothetical protein, partial [Bacillus pseudomycoides]